MNMPFAEGPAPQAQIASWARLERLADPSNSPVRIIAQLLSGCSTNPVDHSVAIAMFVMRCCQLANHGLTRCTPSMILVNAKEIADDPIDHFANGLGTDAPYIPPQIRDTGGFALRKPEEAEQCMEYAILQIKEIKGTNLLEAHQHNILESLFFDAQKSGFGSGLCRPYATAWHAKFGLLSERGCQPTLRLETHEDRVAFRKDIVSGSDKLLAPCGFGPGLKVINKHFCITGVIGADFWDADLAEGLVELALPLLVLPHATTSPLTTPDDYLIDPIINSLNQTWKHPLVEPDNFVPHPWFHRYSSELRKRLHHLPVDYEHALQRLARQLFPACTQLVSSADRISLTGPSDAREIEKLALDLCAHTLRCLTLSIAGLAWHGLGFDAGCSRKEMIRALNFLRGKPPMTAAEFRREAHLKSKEMRDVLIERFLEEDLVQMDGQKIRATTFDEFITALHTRQAFPQPANDWDQ